MKTVIGLTGGAGAGKSLIMEIMEKVYGALVVQEDRLDKTLTAPGCESYYRVVEAFGAEILEMDSDDEVEPPIDRKKLAEVVFGDASGERLERLNSIVHPAVLHAVEGLIAQADGLIVIETALPRAAKLTDFCHEIWYVHADEDVRIRRLSDSRGYSPERCKATLGSQDSDAEYRAIADRVIENDGDVEKLVEQLTSIMAELENRA